MDNHNTLDRGGGHTACLPICANCHRIRDDNGCWSRMDGDLMDDPEAEFSHGICPSCARELYPEFYHIDE